MKDYYVGLDLSLNHFGIVLMDEKGAIQNVALLVDRKKFFDVSFESIRPIFELGPSRFDDEDKELFKARRRSLIFTSLVNFLVAWGEWGRLIVNIEGYAMGVLSNNSLNLS